MDRRSWLWRRKKSPNGETESSGSISSRSERLSDDQSLSNHNTQSPEVTSRAVPSDEKIDDNLKTVPEKLSEALLDIRSKEDLVAEHARVAEEAVSGWERAENEVLILKKQVDVLMLKNSALEERISHLDGALKECMRQLRQERESKKEKIYEEFRINQDKELTIAASKFAACQKTIASLGLQLKSLATLEDLMMDPEELML